MSPELQAAFAAAPPAARAGMLALRALVLDEAARTPGALPLTESLKWGQPAWRAPRGTTIRTGPAPVAAFALYLHCRTPLIAEFRDGPAAGSRLRFDGGRAVLFDRVEDISPHLLRPLIRRALNWHAR